MKVLSVTASLLLAGSAVAAPADLKAKLKAKRSERMQKRLEARQRRTLPPLAVNYTDFSDTVNIGSSKSVSYDSNWAGAVTTTTGVTSVFGTFTVPHVSVPAGGKSNEEYGASAWVGIDGDSCQTAILQTGIDFLAEGSETAYSGWYEWYPYASYSFSNFEVSAGNQIKATVHATGSKSGTATLENISTGKTVTHTFTNEAKGTLCGYDAEWIVEDFESGSSLIGFADFDSVTFTNAGYDTGSGSHGVSGAQVVDIEQNGKVYTSCSTSGSSTVKCTYQ